MKTKVARARSWSRGYSHAHITFGIRINHIYSWDETVGFTVQFCFGHHYLQYTSREIR